MPQNTDNTLSCMEEVLLLSYNVSDICRYELSQKTLKFCRNGAHLQNCKVFQCNMMFKCHRAYCIPWNYVCDGRIDCPQGYDELKEYECSQVRNCSGMMKCKDTQICVHLGRVCDGEDNCPFSEDEMLCSLKQYSCLPECRCLTFVIRCFDFGHQLPETNNLPFYAVFLTEAKLKKRSTASRRFWEGVAVVCHRLKTSEFLSCNQSFARSAYTGCQIQFFGFHFCFLFWWFSSAYSYHPCPQQNFSDTKGHFSVSRKPSNFGHIKQLVGDVNF